MASPEYLSKLVEQAKAFLPAHLFKRFISYARAHAGGKAKARNRKRDEDIVKAALGIESVEKGFLNGSPEAGVHPHTLLRSQSKTMQDGPHLHFWVMPDGEVVINREDGPHEHKLESSTADKTEKDGAHTHVLLLKDGTEIITEKGGEHEHALLVETTAFDGLHGHKIKVDGGTLESLTAGQFIERFGPFDDQTIPLISAKFITQEIANHIMSSVNPGTEVSKSDQTVLAALGMTIKKQFVTQSIIISKDLHDNMSDARKEALKFVTEDEGKGMKAGDETSTSFRFRIRPPGNFREGGLRTFNPPKTDGISIVGGELKAGVDKAIHIPEDQKKKSDETNERTVPIIKVDKDRQMVYGVVLEANSVDTQGEFMKADEIESTAHAYIQKSRVIGLGHTKVADAELIESVILHKGDSFYGTKFQKTSWVVGVFIKDAAIWKKVDSGEINAFSVGGFGKIVKGKIDQAA